MFQNDHAAAEQMYFEETASYCIFMATTPLTVPGGAFLLYLIDSTIILLCRYNPVA